MDNINLTHGANYYFLMGSPGDGLTQLEFHVQSFSGIGLMLNEVEMPWVSLQAKFPGDKLTWNPLNLEVLIDQNYTVLQELYDYLTILHNPDLNTLNPANFQSELHLTNNKNNAHKVIRFYNSWITSYSDIQETVNLVENMPLVVTVEVNYDWYKILDVDET